MRYFKAGIIDLFVGIGIGSFISLLSFTLYQGTPSIKQFILLMTMSAIMGLLSLIFEYDKITFVTQFISHFILEMITYGIFIWLMIGDVDDMLVNIPTFVITYGIVFIFFNINSRANARRINAQLADKKRE